jgi:hypothetical protein
MHYSSTQSRPEDALGERTPAFNVVIAYEDFETGKRAKETCDFIVEHLGRDCRFANQMWNFHVLNIPQVRQAAVQDALQADLIVLASHGARELPRGVQDWLEAWLAAGARPLALVGLFDGCAAAAEKLRALRAGLARVARRARCEFFADPGHWPPATLPGARAVLDKVVGVPEKAVSALADAVQRGFPAMRWGINE